MTKHPPPVFSTEWKDGLFLLNPAWYAGPLTVFLIATNGLAPSLNSIELIRTLALRLSHGTPKGDPSDIALLAALTLLLLPLCIAGVFLVLWPKRDLHVRVTIDSRGKPAPLTEVGMIAMFCLAFWSTILDTAPSSCARCPPAGSTALHAMNALGLWMMSILPFGVAVTIYTRLVLWSQPRN